MKLKTTLFGNVYQFKDVKGCWLKPTNCVRGMCWRALLRKLTGARGGKAGVVGNDCSGHRNNPVIAYEDDCVTRLIQDALTKRPTTRLKTGASANCVSCAER